MVSLEPVVERIFEEALSLKASDIHLEPTEKGLQLRWRINGRMLDGPILGGALKDSLVAKLKLMARLDSTQTQLPQDGAFVLKDTQVRVSVIPVLNGESIVMRIFRRVGDLERLEGLGLEPDQIAEIKKAIGRLHGLFIIAGPTGSGKTTTFYATLRAIDTQAQKIITVEDPIEQRLEGVCQTPVKGGLNFATALRSILRQSPNVIGVGELRDLESARMALQAALTGHLVVATLHADSAAQVSARLIDMGLEPAILAEVLSCVVSQRLMITRSQKGESVTGVFEVMRPSVAVLQAIKSCQSAPELQRILSGEGFIAMRERAAGLVKTGKITQEAVLSEFV